MASFLDQQLTGFTQTSLAYVQPAVSGTVLVSMVNTGWLPLGLTVFVEGGGYYTVTKIVDGSRALLTNVGGANNASPTTTVPAPARVLGVGAGGASGLPVGSSPQNGFVLAWDNPTASYVLTPKNGLTITSFAHSPTLLEWGQSLVTPAFTAAYNTTPTTVFLTNSADSESVNASATPTAFSSGHTFPNTVVNATQSFYLDATIPGTPTVRATLTFTWGQRSYAGVVAAGASPATLVAAATFNSLETARAFSFTISDDGTHRGQVYLPTRYGTPTLKDRSTGFGIAVTLLGTASRTNAQGQSENYNQYQFASGFTGSLTVDVT